jgi:hypothetical protein
MVLEKGGQDQRTNVGKMRKDYIQWRKGLFYIE